MLVLSRKISQQIRIGSDIVITVVKIDRGQVRLGITAPAGVPILREELLEKRKSCQAISDFDHDSPSPSPPTASWLLSAGCH
jgi:carbon storage regulator